MEDLSNPESGDMSVDDAVQSLLQPLEAKQEDEAEAPQEAQPEPEESEGSEVAADEDAPDSEGVEAEEEPSEPEMFTVKVDGEEIQVNAAELKDGYQRQADYQRKTQTLADDRRALEAERAEIAKLQERYQAALQEVAKSEEPEPDWQKMADEDPLGYVQEKAKWDAAQLAKEKAQQQIQQEQQAAMQKASQEGFQRLRAAIPEWSDQAVLQKDMGSMVDTASKAYGFKPEEVAMATDHRVFLMLRDATRYRELQSKAKAKPKAKTAPKALSPGAKPPKQSGKGADAAEKLRRTGSVDDAVAWLMSGD